MIRLIFILLFVANFLHSQEVIYNNVMTLNKTENKVSVTNFELNNSYSVVTNSSIVSGNTDLDVSGKCFFIFQTAGSAVALQGFSNGTSGQIVRIVCTPENTTGVLIKNDGTGTQKIYTNTGSDTTITGIGSAEFLSDGSSWLLINILE